MEESPNTPEPTEVELVGSKAEQAYHLLRIGHSPSDVARDVGYRSTSVMRRAIKEKMGSDAAKLDSDEREGILHMELEMLYDLRRAHYEAAMIGDLKSAEVLLKVHDRVMKAIGADSMDTQTQQHAVLVIGGSEADYVEKLKELT